MKLLIAFILLLSTLHAVAAKGGASSDLYLSVTLTRTERSRDSSSRKTTITVNENNIVYERIHRGAGRTRVEPVRKEFRLADEEMKRLEKVVVDHDLLTSGKLEYPTEGGGLVYFEISLDVRFDGKQAQIELTGPSKAAGVRDEKLFKNSNALVEEIFRILSAHDAEIRYENDLVAQTKAVD